MKGQKTPERERMVQLMEPTTTRILEELAWLRALYSEPPDATALARFQDETRDDAVWTALTQTLEGFATSDLGTEWMRLFEGPGRIPVPLFGSFYLDTGLLMGPSTQAVLSVYARHGLHPAATIPADHLAYELGFCGFLTTQAESDAMQERKRFAERWVLSWLPAMADSLHQATEIPFFRQLALSTVAIVGQLV